MKRELAENVNLMVLKHLSELNKSIVKVKGECSEDEVKRYLKPISHIMALLFDVLDNIYKDYPDLKPETFD